jgi:hypothetical protein
VAVVVEKALQRLADARPPLDDLRSGLLQGVVEIDDAEWA